MTIIDRAMSDPRVRTISIFKDDRARVGVILGHVVTEVSVYGNDIRKEARTKMVLGSTLEETLSLVMEAAFGREEADILGDLL